MSIKFFLFLLYQYLLSTVLAFEVSIQSLLAHALASYAWAMTILVKSGDRMYATVTTHQTRAHTKVAQYSVGRVYISMGIYIVF